MENEDDLLDTTPDVPTSAPATTPAPEADKSEPKWESPFETAERAYEALEESDEEITNEETGRGPGTIEMPPNFPEHIADKWEQWPDDVRESLIEMHSEMADEARRWVDDAKKVMGQTEGIRKAIEPYASKLTWAAGSVENALNRVLMIYDRYLDNPREALAFLAKDAGIDLGQIGQQSQQAQRQQWEAMTPAERALAQEVQSLKAWQAQQLEKAQKMEQAQAAQMRGRYETAIEQMRNAVDRSGAPAYPYFDAVRHEMAELVRAQRARGQDPDLEAAYREAVYRNPEVRARYLEEEFESRQRQKASRVEQARTKAQSLRSGGGQPRDRNGRYVALDNESAEDTARRIATDLGYI